MTPSMPPPVDIQSALATPAAAFPFVSELSLAPLAEFWRRTAALDHSLKGAIGKVVESRLRETPVLAEPIHDLAVLAEHRDLVEALMAVVFPPVFWEKEYGAALVPFQPRSFYATPSFQATLMGPDGRLQGHVGTDAAAMADTRLRYAYALILDQVYGIKTSVESSRVFTVAERETGLDRHFRMLFDWRFIEVIPVGPAPEIPEEVRRRLAQGPVDLATLAGVIPAGSFRFRGFTVFRAVEVTDQEVLSSIERDLIDKESIVSTARFEALQDKLRTLLRQPTLVFGLAAVDGERVLKLNHGARLEHSCIFADSVHRRLPDFDGSVYQRATLSGAPLVIDDLATYPERTCIEDALLEMGARSMIVAPLFYQDQFIGCLDLASPTPGDFTAALLPKLERVLPLFTMAVKRSMDELNNRIQAFIKEKCTAIHPVVEWRFRKAVLDSMEGGPGAAGSPSGELPPIVFPEVYPLYALTDIRGSSTQRAWAIQADLLAQLALARDVLRAAHRARPLPILDQLGSRIDVHAADIEVSMRSGEELTIIEFLRGEVESLFAHLESFGGPVSERITAYREALDPHLGVVYRRRKAFEESLTLLTDTIAGYLDLEEQAAQSMFPHYFERQKTDGVDYTIYVGASLLEDGRFEPLYLRNLRLWQLMVACGAALRAEQIKSRLAVPLEATSLVLLQNAPLAIRFRFDEKRFDVDGAYNARYEIIKKRIDKAVIRGTTERLTQPGKIAIVYSQPSEAAECRGYLEYLRRLGYLGREVEDLELEELQGAHGLQALRVSVDLSRAPAEAPSTAARLAAAGGLAISS